MTWPRIAFFGTPPFAAAALEALLAAGCPVPLVFTQPDRPAGRGQKTTPSAVRELAVAHGLKVATPLTWKAERGGAATEEAYATLAAIEPELLIVAAYGLLLPPRLLALPAGVGKEKITAINLHASLLPRWRGAAPVARAIEAGDATTGITLMQMEAGLDTGPMLVAETIAIEPADTTASLTARLAALGGRMIVAALRDAASLVATPQPGEGVTYAHKLDKREAWLDWSRPADELARRIRAFDPAPGAVAGSHGETVKIWRAEVAVGSADASPGTILGCDRAGLSIACGSGSVLRATQLQKPGGRRIDAAAFCAGGGALTRTGTCFTDRAPG